MTDTTTTGAILVQDTLGRVRTPRERREQILDECKRHMKHSLDGAPVQ
jgi:hypothetical protein